MRICTKCKESKELSEFNFRNRTKGTYKSQCKVCAYAAKYYYSECICGKQKRNVSNLCQDCKTKAVREKTDYDNLTIGDKIYTKHKYAK